MAIYVSPIALGTVVAGVTVSITWLYKSLRRNSNSNNKRIIIFSRYPRPGFAKTRLIGELGSDGAAAVQNYLVNHLLHQVEDFLTSAAYKNTTVELQYSDGSTHEVQYWLERRKKSIPQFQWSPQASGHLGVKMSLAFKKAFKEGVDSVVLVASDTPGIQSDILSEAFQRLNGKSHVMVLGAATDGGYYLVGLHRCSQESLESLFEGIQWSTSDVYERQVEVAQSHNLQVYTLSKKLQDIDSRKRLEFKASDIVSHGGKIYVGQSPNLLIHTVSKRLQAIDTPEDLPEFAEKVGISLEELKTPILSVIVPTYNEESTICSTLDSLVSNIRFPSYVEIIVSDGGSIDSTRRLVQEYAESCTSCKITLIDSQKGRGIQLNNGVKHSNGFNLLFVHSDTTLPRAYDGHVMVTLAEPGVVSGAFEFSLDILEKNEDYEGSDSTEKRNLFSMLFKYQMMALTWFTNRRAKRHELPYGDQALFMSRRTYDAVGRFPEYRLMEDYAMVKKLQQVGHIKIVEGAKAVTSSRRWQQHGIVKVTGFNRIVVILYHLGVHPDTLARWYYGWFR